MDGLTIRRCAAPPSIIASRANSAHSALAADACKAVHNVLLPSIGIAAGPALLTKLCDRRSPLAQALQRPGTLGIGAVRLTPRRHASATSYEPRVSGNGYTASGVDPLPHVTQPEAAANVSPQLTVPFVQSPPPSAYVILRNAPEQQKVP